MVVASTSLRFARHHFVVFVSLAIGWCAGLDLIHTLAIGSVHVFRAQGVNLGIQLWIVARFLQSLSMVAALACMRRRIAAAYLFVGYSVVVVAALASRAVRFPEWAPVDPIITAPSGIWSTSPCQKSGAPSDQSSKL